MAALTLLSRLILFTLAVHRQIRHCDLHYHLDYLRKPKGISSKAPWPSKKLLFVLIQPQNWSFFPPGRGAYYHATSYAVQRNLLCGTPLEVSSNISSNQWQLMVNLGYLAATYKELIRRVLTRNGFIHHHDGVAEHVSLTSLGARPGNISKPTTCQCEPWGRQLLLPKTICIEG
jgi:hypothetical protein